jgi:hypothetical protein
MRHDDTLILDEAESMGRPPKANKLGNPLNIRFTKDQIKRIDKLLKDGRDDWATLGIHERTHLIRHLVEMALKTLEEATPMFGFPKRKR